MACPITFDNTPSSGVISGAASNNGVWEYIGYSATVGGPFGAGGNFPVSAPAWGDSVDISNVVEGFYQFKYKSALDPSDDCYGEALYIIPIVQGTTDVPTDVAIDLCSNDPAQNIYNDSGIFDESAVNPVDTAIGGAGTSSPGYAAGGAVITDDTYDPSAESTYPVTRVFSITYTPQAPGGYTLSGCTNCAAKTVNVTYNVTEAFNAGNPSNIAACNDGDV